MHHHIVIDHDSRFHYVVLSADRMTETAVVMAFRASIPGGPAAGRVWKTFILPPPGVDLPLGQFWKGVLSEGRLATVDAGLRIRFVVFGAEGFPEKELLRYVRLEGVQMGQLFDNWKACIVHWPDESP
jgi:hypothetical protein